MLGHRRVDVQRQFVGFGHIARDKAHPALHQISDKRHIARQLIQLGDNQRRPLLPTEAQRRFEFGLVVALAGLKLLKTGEYDRALFALDKTLDGSGLSFKAETGAGPFVVETRY